MKVAERTVADKKGGHLTKRKSGGRLLLRESAMVSDEDKAAFEDITKCALSGGTLESTFIPIGELSDSRCAHQGFPSRICGCRLANC